LQQKENIEYRTTNVECRSYLAAETLHHSKFPVRYSFQAHGTFASLELAPAAELAKQFRAIKN
jgi:hypothetical protein